MLFVYSSYNLVAKIHINNEEPSINSDLLLYFLIKTAYKNPKKGCIAAPFIIYVIVISRLLHLSTRQRECLVTLNDYETILCHHLLNCRSSNLSSIY